MLIKKEKHGDITIYHVDKNISDEKMATLGNTYVKESQIDLIITDDADVYNAEGELLLRFRKNKLTKNKVDDFYDNVIHFAKNISTNRGTTSGSKSRNIRTNPHIMTNILGYFDKLSPRTKYYLKLNGVKLQSEVRETRFNMEHPEKFKAILPLIKEIDDYYKKYVPDKYAKQIKKANQIHFKIPGTSFTTITTNVNFRTTIHKDKGDDNEGFGNLAVIEHGKYSGAETCFPQYGIGVDVRSGDILYMDVHQWHGNLPMKKESADAERLSIVCYLRRNIWDKTKGRSKRYMLKHNATLKKHGKLHKE